MSVLSEREIKRELGRGIVIYPFNKDTSLRGARLCLTASKYAYSIKEKQLLAVHVDSQSHGKFVNIKPKDTTLIWTNESVLLSDAYCGTIHSKVSFVSKGIGNIGTTVNPNWSGILCIALHNLSDSDIRINVTEEPDNSDNSGEVIAYLRFHQLSSRSSTPPNLDDPGRTDAIPEGNSPEELKSWINDPKYRWRRGNKDALIEALQDSSSYKKVKKELQQNSIQYLVGSAFKKLAPPLTVTLFIVFYLLISKKRDFADLLLVLIPLVYTMIAELVKDTR